MRITFYFFLLFSFVFVSFCSAIPDAGGSDASIGNLSNSSFVLNHNTDLIINISNSSLASNGYNGNATFTISCQITYEFQQLQLLRDTTVSINFNKSLKVKLPNNWDNSQVGQYFLLVYVRNPSKSHTFDSAQKPFYIHEDNVPLVSIDPNEGTVEDPSIKSIYFQYKIWDLEADQCSLTVYASKSSNPFTSPTHKKTISKNISTSKTEPASWSTYTWDINSKLEGKWYYGLIVTELLNGATSKSNITYIEATPTPTINSIDGLASITEGQSSSYSANITGYNLNYSWTVSSGLTIVSGQGTGTVTVRANTLSGSTSIAHESLILNANTTGFSSVSKTYDIDILKASPTWGNYFTISNIHFTDNHNENANSSDGIIVNFDLNYSGNFVLDQYSLKLIAEDFPSLPIQDLPSITKPGSYSIKVRLDGLPQQYQSKLIKILIDNINGDPTQISSTKTVTIYRSKNVFGRSFNTNIDAYNFVNDGVLSTPLLLAYFTEIGFSPLVVGNLISAYFESLTIGSGLCHGFASSAGMFFLDSLMKPAGLVYNPTHSYSSSNIDVLRYIIKYHITQAYQLFGNLSTKDPKEVYSNIESSTKAGICSILGLRSSNNSDLKHAMLVYKTVFDESSNMGYHFSYENASNTPIGIASYNLETNKFTYDNSMGIYDIPNQLMIIPAIDNTTAYNYLINLSNAYFSNLIKSNQKVFVSACPTNLIVVDNHGDTTGFTGKSIINKIPGSYFKLIPLSNDTVHKVCICYIPNDVPCSAYFINTDSGSIFMQYSSLNNGSVINRWNVVRSTGKSLFTINNNNDSIKCDQNNDGSIDSVVILNTSTSSNTGLTLTDNFNDGKFNLITTAICGKSVNIHCYCNTSTDLSLALFNIQGQLLSKAAYQIKIGHNHVSLGGIKSRGVYFLSLNGPTKRTIKLISL